MNPEKTTPDIIGIVKALKESGQIHAFHPYCIGVITSEESAMLDCPLGDEYAVFRAGHRPLLCDWHCGKFSVAQLAEALLIAVEALEWFEKCEAAHTFGKANEQDQWKLDFFNQVVLKPVNDHAKQTLSRIRSLTPKQHDE